MVFTTTTTLFCWDIKGLADRHVVKIKIVYSTCSQALTPLVLQPLVILCLVIASFSFLPKKIISRIFFLSRKKFASKIQVLQKKKFQLKNSLQITSFLIVKNQLLLVHYQESIFRWIFFLLK